MERYGFKSWSGSFPAYDPEPGLSLPWCLVFLHPKGFCKDWKYVWALSTEKILINGGDVRTASLPGIPPEWPHSFSHPDHPDPNPSLKRPAGAAFTSRETLLIKKQRTGSKQERRELGKASSHAPSCLLTLQSPAQGLTLLKLLTHILNEPLNGWMGALWILYTQVSLESLLHIRRDLCLVSWSQKISSRKVLLVYLKAPSMISDETMDDHRKGGAVLGTLIKGKSTRLIKDTVAFWCFH